MLPEICVVADGNVKHGADGHDVAFQVPDKTKGPLIVQPLEPPLKTEPAEAPAPMLNVKPVAPTTLVELPAVKVVAAVPCV